MERKRKKAWKVLILRGFTQEKSDHFLWPLMLDFDDYQTVYSFFDRINEFTKVRWKNAKY